MNEVHSKSTISLILVVFGLSFASACMAQQGSQPSPTTADIDALSRERVLSAAITKLNQFYVSPDMAKTMERMLRAHQKRHDYDAITTGSEFASLITTQMRSVSHDNHLSLAYSPGTLPDFTAALTLKQVEDNRRRDERVNCAFGKVEILDNNVGYVKLGGFGPTETCAATASAAMNFVANSDAVIIDMRGPGGGQASTVVYLESYLFDQPVHVNDIWTRSTDSIQQFWTQWVPGKRLTVAPVYILTSAHTFSAGEELAYDLQAQKRAIIVGETTAGGANPTRPERLDDHFFLNLPFGRAINPITKTNWELVGVKPDVMVAADEALATAQKLAAERIASMQRSGAAATH